MSAAPTNTAPRHLGDAIGALDRASVALAEIMRPLRVTIRSAEPPGRPTFALAQLEQFEGWAKHVEGLRAEMLERLSGATLAADLARERT